jgi:predicted RND superfamily exporter protein
MILIIIVILLANPVASAVTFACVASAILELIGLMYFIGQRIDSVTIIFLVISLGLAVDYSVHVAHGFLATRTNDMTARIERTMTVRLVSA